jgi:hypothetical protein
MAAFCFVIFATRLTDICTHKHVKNSDEMFGIISSKEGI